MTNITTKMVESIEEELTILETEIKRIDQFHSTVDLHHKPNLVFTSVPSFNLMRIFLAFLVVVSVVKKQA